MESKFCLRDKAKVKYLDGKHTNILTKASVYASSSSSSSSSRCSCSSKEQNSRSKCDDSVIEFACSACVFCIFCPLSLFWCCAKLPCTIGWRTAKWAIRWACCGSDKRVFVDYSSFSDIDFDDSCKSPGTSSYPSSSARSRSRRRCP